MIKELDFGKVLDGGAYGRNGTMKTKGLMLTPTNTYVTLTPITSRGNPGRCGIDVPLDAIPKLVSLLRSIVNRKDMEELERQEASVRQSLELRDKPVNFDN